MIRAVIFDLDNTIYDYDVCNERAMNVLEEYCIQKFSMTRIRFRQNFEFAKKVVKKRIEDTGASHNRMLYMQNFLEKSGKKPALYSLELYNVYWDAMLADMRPFPYVRPLFNYLSEKQIKTGVLTDLTAHIQHRKLQALGIAEYADVIVTSEEAGKEKPDRCMFDLIIEKSGFEPEELLMIGDSYEKDILGAYAAGMHAILFRKEMKESVLEQCLEMITRGEDEKQDS